MKKSVIAALALLLVASFASANVIGVFADADATACDITLGATYGNVAIHFAVMLTDIPALTAVEFGTSGIESLVAPAGWVPGWASPLVIDNPATLAGGSIAFSSPQAGPLVYLGNISTFDVAANPSDVMLCVVPTEGGNLKIVDEAFLEYTAQGWCAIVNCTGVCDCEGVPTEDSSWSEVKALY